MSDNLSQKIEAAAENSYVKLVARLALPAIAFVGLSAWNDLKGQGDKITLMLQNMSRYEQSLDDAKRRIGDLEDWQKEITYRGVKP